MNKYYSSILNKVTLFEILINKLSYYLHWFAGFFIRFAKSKTFFFYPIIIKRNSIDSQINFNLKSRKFT